MGDSMRILISAGPIPAKLDSVKFIGNRFKGGLALKTAKGLLDRGFEDITIVKWRYNRIEVDPRFNVVNVSDVMDYYRYVTQSGVVFDAYILAAAVANLMPTPGQFWGEGKFPSHNYIEGDQFDIKFSIAPRIIERIKGIMTPPGNDLHLKGIAPRSALIGYKLLDGTEEELISGAKEVQRRSKANIIFANDPKWAKVRKLAVMSDGSVIPMSFNEHTDFIAQMLRAKWFRTEIVDLDMPKITAEDRKLIETHPRTKDGDLAFGTFAIRKGDGFLTTTRGRKTPPDQGGPGMCPSCGNANFERDRQRKGGLCTACTWPLEGDKTEDPTPFCYVEHVNFNDRIVHATEKATLNAPLLAHIFADQPECQVILHNHQQLRGVEKVPYASPGTTDELVAYNHAPLRCNNPQGGFNIEHHGYMLYFNSIEDALDHPLMRWFT